MRCAKSSQPTRWLPVENGHHPSRVHDLTGSMSIVSKLRPLWRQVSTYSSHGFRCLFVESQSRHDKRKTKPENIFLHTFPRGGSTVLAEVVAKSGGCPIVWEPLFKGRVPFRKFPHTKLWGWRESIGRGVAKTPVDGYLDAIYWREFLSPRFFTGQQSLGLSPRGTLVYKFCHAGEMTSHIINKYPAKHVFLHRHIGQIMASRIRYGVFMKNNQPHGNELYPTGEKHKKFSEDTQSSEELTARKNLITSALGVEVWDYCLARKNWEKAHQENETLWLDYDDLVLNPQNVADALTEYLGFRIDVNQFKRPSRVTVEANQTKSERLAKWRSRLSSAQILEMNKILEWHGFEKVGE